MTEPVLRVAGIAKRYGGVQALRDVSLTVLPGTVHCLAGENGSGKSTLIKIISGAVRPDRGTITLSGVPRRALTPRDAIHGGIQVIHQDLSLFPNLTVAENIAAAQFVAQNRFLFRPADAHRIAKAAAEQVQVPLDLEARVGDLPVSARQITAICRALAQDARIIFMDEPTTALSWREVQTLFAVIQRATERGVAVVFVSHKFNEIFEISQHITVLRDGEVVGDGPAGGFTRAGLSQLMTGHEVTGLNRAQTAGTGKPVLEVSALASAGAFTDISFTVGGGEIVGLIGLLGSGHIEVAEALFGLRTTDAGKVRIAGTEHHIRSVADAMRHGIGYVPGDRLTEGLFLDHSVAQNIIAASTADLPRTGGLVLRGTIRRIAQEMVTGLSIRTPSTQTPVRHLSGGNQQRVVVAKWLQRNPRLLALNGPTMGVDIGSRREILRLLQQMSQQGTSVLVLSDDVAEVVEVCHRVFVMRGGSIVTEIAGADISEEAIMNELVAA